MKTRNTGRLIGWLAAALVAAVAITWAMWPRPTLVDTAQVTRGDLTASVRGEGRARVKELYLVTAPVDGDLQRIELEEGSEVTEGQILATINPLTPRLLDDRAYSEAVAAISAARAAVERADAAEREAVVAAAHADSLLATSRKLAETSAGSQKDVEHAEHEAQLRRDALEGAQAAARQARAELDRALAVIGADVQSTTTAQVVVKAPIAGRVLRVVRESAGPVAVGAPLIELGDVNQLEVVADLLSRDAAAVAVGASARVSRWGPGPALAARVRRVERAAFTKVSALGLEEQRANVVLDLVAPAPPGLGHDYRVDVAVETWSGTNVLRVPSTALFRAGDRWAVFAVRDGDARLAMLELGAADESWTVIAGGLNEGEEVVVQPNDQLADGVGVRSRNVQGTSER